MLKKRKQFKDKGERIFEKHMRCDTIDLAIKKVPAIEVAKAVEHALTSTKPKLYYLVGIDAKGAAKASLFPKRGLD